MRLFLLLLWAPLAGAANPPVPSGARPRLFMSASNLAAYTTNAGMTGTAAKSFAARCQDTLANPNDYTTRGGADGDNWPGAAVACAFAYLTGNNAQHLTQALKYWHAALDDDQTLGDHLGC